MKYTINDEIVYNSSDGTLLSADNTVGMITLTRVTSELLFLLIKNSGCPISREFILSELWDKKGLTSSSNNLNNHVSMLRKALAQCGAFDLITTIPKFGFVFEADVKPIDNIASEHEEGDSGHDPQCEPLPVGIESHFIKKFMPQKKIKIAVLIFSLTLLIHFPWVYNHYRLQSIRTEILRLKQCRIYLADDLTRSMPLASTIKTIEKTLEKNNRNCSYEVNVYYFAQKKQDSYGQRTINYLLAYCPFNKKISCANYYINKYESES